MISFHILINTAFVLLFLKMKTTKIIRVCKLTPFLFFFLLSFIVFRLFLPFFFGREILHSNTCFHCHARNIYNAVIAPKIFKIALEDFISKESVECWETTWRNKASSATVSGLGKHNHYRWYSIWFHGKSSIRFCLIFETVLNHDINWH